MLQLLNLVPPQVHCSSHTTSVETDPYLVLSGSAPRLDMEGTRKIHSSDGKRGLPAHSEFRQWRRRGSNEPSSFKSSANDTLVDTHLHKCSTLDDPKLRLNFSECFFHTIVKNSQVYTSYN